MTFIIQKIEDFSASVGSYYAAFSVSVAILSVLVCFFSHRLREAIGYTVGVIAGSMIGTVVASIILVTSTNEILRGLITLCTALLVLYAQVKVPFMSGALMIFTPSAIVVGFPLARATGSAGVGVFVGLVIGILVTVIGMKVGRYFVICINALVGAFAAVLGILSTFGLLSKVYEADSLYLFIPMLLLAGLGASYQIYTNPERLAEKAAAIAAEEERIRLETAGVTWPCKHCYTTNKKELLYCRECGKTEMEPKAPVGVHLPDDANPGWRCACGRINDLSCHKCECGSHIGVAKEWACSCGVRNGGMAGVCTGCGQLRYQPYARSYTPVEVPKVGHAHVNA